MKKKIVVILGLLVVIGGLSFWFLEDSFYIPSIKAIEVLNGDNPGMADVVVHRMFSSYSMSVDLSDVDMSHPGEYEVEVSEQWLWMKRDAVLTVKVIDMTPPVIKLSQGKTISFETGSEFVDPGVTVSDDSGEECILESSFEGDMNTPGIYRCVYRAEDSSGNVNYNNIDVAIGDGLSWDYVNSGEFNIETNYEFHKKNNLFNEIIFVGDSNIREMSYSRFLNSDNCVAAPALMPPEFYSRLCTYKEYEDVITPYDVIVERQPDYVAIEWGIINVESGGLTKFIENYEEVIKSIHEIKPDTEIYLISILPVIPVEGSTKPSNGAINVYNYYLKWLADVEGCYYVNVAEVLKDESGNANLDYYEEDGYHLNDKGKRVFVDYLKNRIPVVRE